MSKRVDSKSMILGVVLGGALCLLVAAAADRPTGPVGRFQIACTQTGGYLVDTVTGQVWHNSERGFRGPKLQGESVPEDRVPATPSGREVRNERRPRTHATGFVGTWILPHPTEGQLSIQIEPDGRAILTEGNKSWEGKWRIEGSEITITAEQETITAQIDDQDRLLVKEGDGEPIAFKRAQ